MIKHAQTYLKRISSATQASCSPAGFSSFAPGSSELCTDSCFPESLGSAPEPAGVGSEFAGIALESSGSAAETSSFVLES